METILTACVMMNGKIPLFCKRHGDGIFIAGKIYGTYIDRRRQGFWTDSGRFLNRKEAMDLAKKNGQLIKVDKSGNLIDYSDREELHSEDLR
ncbi:MAG: hypothetical protein HG424_000840 [candidate division SR1 bacterium]|nr:hypothetical protein [candidate division SR1 bacterium]